MGPFAREMRNASAVISFSEKDHCVPYKRNKPLYDRGCEWIGVQKNILNRGPSINVMPLTVFKATRILEHRLVKQLVEINVFGEPRKTLGQVRIDPRGWKDPGF